MAEDHRVHLPAPMLHVRQEESPRQLTEVQPPEGPLLVLKVGTSSLMDENCDAFSLTTIGKLVDTIVLMKSRGFHVALITSGAVGAGCLHLRLKERPTSIVGKQAASAVGQCRLMRLYEDLFAIRDQRVAQLLITRTDFSDKSRFLHFKNTLLQLMHMDVVPVINENDSVASNALKFGDNDTLAAYCAISIGAQWLVLLTDVDFLYTSNPRHNPHAHRIPYVGRSDDIYKTLGDDAGTKWGSGGMRTKLVAAKLAAATGVKTAILQGRSPERLLRILSYFSEFERYYSKSEETQQILEASELETKIVEESKAAEEGVAAVVDDHVRLVSGLELRKGVQLGIGLGMDVGIIEAVDQTPYCGTVFAGHEVLKNMADERRWILSLPVRGKLFLDEGAAKAVLLGKKSLFATGIVEVEGVFYEGEAVSIYCATDAQLAERDRRVRDAKEAKVNAKKQSQTTATRSAQDSSSARIRPHSPLSRVASANRLGPTDHHHPPLPAAAVEHESDSADLNLEVARCLTNYPSDEVELIQGLRSSVFEAVLGYSGYPEVAHRSKIVFLDIPAAWNPKRDGSQSPELRCSSRATGSSRPGAPVNLSVPGRGLDDNASKGGVSAVSDNPSDPESDH